MTKVKISTALRSKVLTRDNHICRACGFGGSAAFAPFLDADHAVCEANGGSTDLLNLQTLCKHCNGMKGTTDWTFNIRVASATDAEWAHNHKVINSAFVRDTAKRLRKLK